VTYYSVLNWDLDLQSYSQPSGFEKKKKQKNKKPTICNMLNAAVEMCKVAGGK
jgi:hypothetical protein